MKTLKLSVIPAFAMMLASCSAAALLNGVTPSSSFDRDKDVRYGDGPRQQMDIYRSDVDTAREAVLIFSHGGGWNARDKKDFKFVAEGFTKEGFDVVVPNYRLYPGMQYPDMVVDSGAAINDVATRFPGRPIILMGHSAGAYNVLQAVAAPEVSGIDPCAQIAGVISLAAPTGVIGLVEEPYISIFPEHRLNGPDGPANRTPARAPPLLLVNGDNDGTVRVSNATEMAKRYQALGLRAQAKIYPGMGHVDAVRYLSRHFDGDSPLKGDILTFIEGLPNGPDFCRS